MSLRDGILLTFFNAVACIVLPRLLSVILATKQSKKPQEQAQEMIEPELTIATTEDSPKVPSYSYR